MPWDSKTNLLGISPNVSVDSESDKNIRHDGRAKPASLSAGPGPDARVKSAPGHSAADPSPGAAAGPDGPIKAANSPDHFTAIGTGAGADSSVKPDTTTDIGASI